MRQNSRLVCVLATRETIPWARYAAGYTRGLIWCCVAQVLTITGEQQNGNHAILATTRCVTRVGSDVSSALRDDTAWKLLIVCIQLADSR